MTVKVRTLTRSDWEAVSGIYAEGMATGMATFESEVSTWDKWNKRYIKK